MIKILYYIFICLALFCAFGRLGLSEYLRTNDKVPNKYYKYCKVTGLLTWVFLIFCATILIYSKMKGVVL